MAFGGIDAPDQDPQFSGFGPLVASWQLVTCDDVFYLLEIKS